MSLWRHITRGLYSLFHRPSTDRDLADEVQDYFDQAVADRVERGFSPAEARRAVQLEFGNAAAVREQVRSYGWENGLETALADVGYAVRRLRRSPGFAITSIITLAIGIGGTTSMFSVVNGVLLKPLPYHAPEQLFSLRHTAPGIGIEQLRMSPAMYFVYSEESRVFEDVSLWVEGRSTVTGLAEPEEIPLLLATNRFLPILGIQPALGRSFQSTDDHPASPRTVLLSNGFWKMRFGANPAVIGRSIVIDGNLHEIIGVLPADAQFLDRRPAVVIPLRFDPNEVRFGNFSYHGLARLKPAATLQAAEADIRRMLPLTASRFSPPPALSPRLLEEARIAPSLQPLKDSLVGNVGSTLWLLMATLGLVLVIACANIANLLLVRAEGRHQELALRAALGAGRARLTRDLLLESVVLGLAGGGVGLVFAWAALPFFTASTRFSLPRMSDISIDPLVLAFTFSVSLIAGLGFGLIPVWRYCRPHLDFHLRSGGRTLSPTKERHRARSVLVVVEVALALVLLISAGLMIRTFRALHDVDPGFSDAQHLQTFRIAISEPQVPEPERVLRMHQEIQNRLASIAGVASVAMTSHLPLTSGPNDPIYAQDRAYHDGAIPPVRRFKAVSPGYVSTLGSRLVAGRDLTWAETYAQKRVVLVSQNLARELWQDPTDAVGKRIRSTHKEGWFEVIGVVADLHDDGVDRPAPAIVYWPLMLPASDVAPLTVRRSLVFMVRTSRAATAGLLRELRQVVSSVNPALPLADLTTLKAEHDRSLARTSITLMLLAIASGMALLLGVVGIYGVISYSVTQRSREIGIRLALGAPPNVVMRIFVHSGLTLSLIGAACGLLAAFGLMRLMRSVLFEVSPADPLTYLVASTCLIMAAVLASYLPARGATKVDPAITLRAE